MPWVFLFPWARCSHKDTRGVISTRFFIIPTLQDMESEMRATSFQYAMRIPIPIFFAFLWLYPVVNAQSSTLDDIALTPAPAIPPSFVPGPGCFSERPARDFSLEMIYNIGCGISAATCCPPRWATHIIYSAQTATISQGSDGCPHGYAGKPTWMGFAMNTRAGYPFRNEGTVVCCPS